MESFPSKHRCVLQGRQAVAVRSLPDRARSIWVRADKGSGGNINSCATHWFLEVGFRGECGSFLGHSETAVSTFPGFSLKKKTVYFQAICF